MIDRILERLEEAKFPITDLKRGVVVNGIQQTDDAVLYARAIEILQEVAEEYGNGWIFCEVEMPKEHEKIGHMRSEQVFVTYLNEDGVSGVSTDHTYDGKWSYFGNRVIAWQPLPAPYQKGE